MKAIFIEEYAVRHIAQGRTFQSIEFEDALNLINFFQTGKDIAINKIQCVVHKDIGVIYHTERTNILFSVVFDLNLLGDLWSCPNSELCTIIQRVIKFSIKQWNNYPLNSSERVINDNHAILFPLPYRDDNPFKILINLSPDKQYEERRNMRCIYVAKMGYGNFDTNDYDTHNLKALYQDVKSAINTTEDYKNACKNPDESPLHVSSLDTSFKSVKGYLSYDAWIPLLSKKQHDFVFAALKGNERLEGAAGTGKTLSLVLRAITLCNCALHDSSELRILFLCHSISTKENLRLMIESTSTIDNILNPDYQMQSIELTTLQEWCTNYLGNSIGQAELLDVDAQECKDLQYHFISEVYSECETNDYPTYQSICSKQFIDFIQNTPRSSLIDMVMSEISITIKGRASGDLERYKQLPRLQGSIPIEDEADYCYLYLIYERYQDSLIKLGYFDNDDISLSSALQLSSPIWKRRRKECGYDVIIIDEVHLFSYNELAIFHNLCRDEKNGRIIYAIDKTQAIGDRGLTKDSLTNTMKISDGEEFRYNTMFRCSPQIVNLAFSILASGAEMFVNFDNPLDKINFSFTEEEERKSTKPQYKLLATDEMMISQVFKEVDSCSKELKIKNDRILIVSVNNQIHCALKKIATEGNKPVEVLTRRGDVGTIRQAEKHNRYVLGYIDYIGGLEFDAVVMVGVDKGRVPQYDGSEAAIYQNYEWHNRMYVAITRAKYSVVILGNQSYTESPLFKRPIEQGLIDLQ